MKCKEFARSVELEKQTIERTPMSEDVKEILTQNRMIIKLNARIIDKILQHPEHRIIDRTIVDDIIKDTKPGTQL